MSYNGYFLNGTFFDIDDGNVTGGYGGIRPVITISKSVLKSLGY